MNSRSKNAFRNIIFGLLLKMYQIIFPFFMRNALIYYLGIEYLGLNSLFTSVLSVLNLAELGVGSALVFYMYKPLSDKDNKKVCEIMNLYKKYYRIIGLIVLLFGLLLCPFLPYLIKSDLPANINLYVLYILNLAITVLTYWLFAYRNSILQANQRNDIISKITLISSTIQYALQFIVLIIFRNYYLYIICNLFSQIINNILVFGISRKIYPKFNPEGNLTKSEIKKINSRVKDLFTSKVGSVIVNSVDTIVISTFLGLKVLAIYQNYFYILTAIFSFIFMIYTSCTASIGNSLIEEPLEKNYNDFKTFSLISFWISSVCVSCLLCGYQEFMLIWVGEKYMLDFNIVICLCIYFYTFNFNQLLCLYKDAAGIWHTDRYRPLVTSLSNLALNLLTVNIWGLYGIILSTVLSTMFIGIPWLFSNIFSSIFNKTKVKEYLLLISKFIIVAFLSCGICYLITKDFQNGIIKFILAMVICIIITSLLFFYVNKNSNELKNVKKLINRLLKKV